jgi:molybdopterin converting factor small subunit
MSDQIKVTMICFSHVRQVLGQRSVELELPVGSTTEDLERVVRDRLGVDLAGMVFRVAVNQEFVDAATALSNGDEVSLIPPMQGGCR